jgi:hypothetical protein
MSNTNTGEPAFPTPRYERGDMYSLGMTLRDYFAAKALKTFSDDTDELMMENAIKAYKQADAMLEARNK